MADDQTSVLKVLIELVDSVTEPLKKINESFEEFSESVHGIWQAGAEVFAGYEAIEGLIEPAVKFAEAQTHLGLAGKFSAEQLKDMKEQAEGLSETLPKGLEDITAAQEELYKTFGAGGNLEESTKMATQLATVLGVDAVTGANVLAAAYEQLGNKSKPVTEEMELLGDKLALLKNRYLKPGEAAGLERDIQRIGKSAQAAGVSQNQMFAIWAEGNKLHAGGPRGFGMVEATLLDTLAKNSKELEKAGLRVVHFTNGGVNVLQTMEQINRMSQSGKMKLFSELPGQAKVLVELSAHLKEIRDTAAEFREPNDELQRTATILANTPEAKIERLKDSLDNLRDALGTELVPQLTKLVDGLTGLVKASNEFLAKHPAVAKGLGDILAGLAGVLTLAGLWSFGKVIIGVVKLAGELLQLPAILEMIQGAWFVLQTAFTEGFAEIGTAALVAFESNPLGWAITAAVAFAAVSYEIYQHWDAISKVIGDVAAALGEMGDMLHLPDFTQHVDAFGNVSINPFSSAGGGMVLHHSPTVNVHVGAGSDGFAVSQAVGAALNGHADDLVQRMSEAKESENRRSFRDPTLAGGH